MEIKAIDVNRESFYGPNDETVNERTKQRLKRMIDCGMVEVERDNFGYDGILSGFYIERVWSYSDNDFDDYLEWAESLYKSKQKT